MAIIEDQNQLSGSQLLLEGLMPLATWSTHTYVYTHPTHMHIKIKIKKKT